MKLFSILFAVLALYCSGTCEARSKEFGNRRDLPESGSPKLTSASNTTRQAASDTLAPSGLDTKRYDQRVATVTTTSGSMRKLTGDATAGDDDDAASVTSGDDDNAGDDQVDADDDFLNPQNNTNPLLRPEPEQPENWPVVLVIAFTVVALVLCLLTGRKVMLRKRRGYEHVSQEVTLVV